jgi:hypothetical protein
MEKLTLTAPDVTPEVSNTSWTPGGLDKDWRNKRLTVTLYGDNGEKRAEVVEGAQAETLMRTLNTANNQIKSEHKRVIEWLIANRGYAGAATGCPIDAEAAGLSALRRGAFG